MFYDCIYCDYSLRQFIFLSHHVRYDMKQNRNEERVNYISKCLLDIKGTSYSGLLENISTTGASVKMIDALPESIVCGCECVLSALLLSPVKYQSRIIRINSSRIALQFLEQ